MAKGGRERLNLILLHSLKGNLIVFLQQRPRRKKRSDRAKGRWDRLKAQVRRTYENLKERLDHHEKVCSELREARELRIVHPASWGSGEAEKRLRQFLKLRYNYHSRWMWVNGVFAVLGSLLTPLPGPNLFFFYPAARVFGHYHARKGAAEALESHRWDFEADAPLDRVQESLGRLKAVRRELEELEGRYRLKRLKKQLKGMRGR